MQKSTAKNLQFEVKTDELAQLNSFLKLVDVNSFANIGRIDGQTEILKKRKPRSQSKGRQRKPKKILPNGIKKPVSCYMLFNKKRMPELNKEFPGKTVGDLAKIIASEWKAMSEEDKQPYRDIHHIEREKYISFRHIDRNQSEFCKENKIENLAKIEPQLQVDPHHQNYAFEADVQIDQYNQDISINGSNQYNFQSTINTLNEPTIESIGMIEDYHQNLYNELNQQQRI